MSGSLFTSRSERFSAWLASWKAPLYVGLVLAWNTATGVLAWRGDWHLVAALVAAATYGMVVQTLRVGNHGSVTGE